MNDEIYHADEMLRNRRDKNGNWSEHQADHLKEDDPMSYAEHQADHLSEDDDNGDWDLSDNGDWE